MARRFRPILVRIPPALAIVGVLLFIGGIFGQYLINRQSPLEESEPSGLTLLALLGLALAVAMFLVWFVTTGLQLGAQARRQGSGYGEAYRLIEAFKFDEAIPLLEQSIQEGKETVDVLMLLASVYAYAGRLAEAQQAADRAVVLYPEESAAYVTLSTIYRIQAVYDAAAEALRQAAELEPDSAAIWAELGFMELYAGEDADAVEAFERASRYPMPAMYAVRVYYHLISVYAERGDAHRAARTAARMVSAREGLASWKSGLTALEGTSYGQRLAREIEEIESALYEADSAHTG